jgi:hypothetical protein
MTLGGADRVVPEFKSLNPDLVTTKLPTQQEARLRELFAETQTLVYIRARSQRQLWARGAIKGAHGFTADGKAMTKERKG